MKKKKITAILLAAFMGISAVPTAVWAADSYKETEKAAFAKIIQEIGADYAKSLAQINEDTVKGNAEIKLSLEDGGKAILGMLTPVDISWLADASVYANVNVNDNTMAESMDVKVNGTKICTVEYYFDTENSEIYMRIPELNEGYIKMNMEQMTETAEAEMEDEGIDSSFTASMDLADAMNSYFSTLDNLPEADTLTSILTRYSDIIFDNVADGENPGTQSVAAGDVSQELTVLEGHVTQKEGIPMFREILDTAKNDEELKGLVESWTAAMNDPEYTYDTFIKAIEDLESDLEGDIDQEDTSGFVLRAWVDGDGEVVGREVLSNDGGEDESLFRYLCTEEGDKRGFSFMVGSGDESFGLEGSGTLSGDVLNGTYTLTSGEEGAALIDVTDYDTKAVEDGIWRGTYTVSGVMTEDESGNSYDPFGGMQLIFTTDGKDANNMEWNISLASGGVSLASVSIAGGNEGADLEVVDFASLTDVYDFSNDADVEKYSQNVNLDAINANLTSAGMPEGWLDSVMEAASGSGTEEFGIEEDQTDMAGDMLEDETPAA